jgi:exodeoxyribonuclease V beta subunit
MPQHINNNFEAKVVPLEGSNLIEASAGTGKTYSIALLTLRLIIEKDIPIEKILMVTFTKAAVAELEIRVRSFVRMALKVSREQQINDDTITTMVQAQIRLQGKEEVAKKLENAQLFLDETSVLTIHSFCQRTLSEYSFETGQIFGAETITPDEYNQLIEDAFNEYWRINITTIRLDYLKRFMTYGLNYEDVFDLLKLSLGGKLLFSNEPKPNNFLNDAYFNDLIQWEAEFNDSIVAAREVIIDKIIAKRQELIDGLTDDRYGKKSPFLPILLKDDWSHEDKETFLNEIIKKKDSDYVVSFFGAYFVEVAALKDMGKGMGKKLKAEVNLIALSAIEYVKNSILEQKKNRGIITFDDMIELLHEAVVNGDYNQQLIANLKKKYDAVFIDEFQDTDKAQYAIFDKLFGEDKILFYIGDPKQSIYAFRKADIFTYFHAKKSVQNLHFMNTNHRSSESYINAMNEFFAPTTNFDTFYFNNDPTIPNAISYINVGSPENNTKGQLLCNDNPMDPIKISEHPNKKMLRKSVKGIITELFTPGKYKIEKDGVKRPIQPSDIGILVKSNKDALALKLLLASLRVPAITIDDTRLLATHEAQQIFYILEAVNKISRANINRALLSDIGGYSDTMLLASDEESILAQFRTYQESWTKHGVYTMLKQFMADHKVYDRLFDTTTENPERTISNIQQLIEILHKIAKNKNYEANELIQWLKKGMEGDAREGDEYQQRLESDQDAVQIVTIHKSKGLEYNIVIAPHLDLLADQDVFTTASYRDPQSGDYYVMNKDLMTEEQYKLYTTQSEQENRRLIYVAITRARYQCFITVINADYYADSALKKFVFVENEQEMDEATEEQEKAEATPRANIKMWIPPAPIRNFIYTSGVGVVKPEYTVANNFSLKQPNWIKTSYSGLNPEHDVIPAPRSVNPLTNSYDKFVFQDLKKGAHTGNLLHYIFEHIDFSDQRNWSRVVEQAMKRLSGSANEEYRDQILLLLGQVISATMPGDNSFHLNQVTIDKRLNELEFDFLLNPFNTAQLQALSSDAHPFRIKTIDELEGIMNGKIDLFFEQNGKYYILDWKSNFLGNSLEFYGEGSVKAAMYENNYNLQYLIYTVALTKYLKLRKPDFDYNKDFGGVIYLFLRGVRADGQTGIYYSKPEEKLIEQIKGLIGG